MDNTNHTVASPISERPATVSDGGPVGPRGKTLSGIVFVIGLVCYIASQTAFFNSVLWERSLPPEADDSLAYLVKTAQMQSCFFQDCRALEDLRRQMSFARSDAEIRRHRSLLMGRIFQVYHPLFSLILLGFAKALNTGLITAYKILWSGAPFLFGAAFAAWSWSLWGRAAAGITLVVLAVTIFPGTGTHYVVPWNCALATALLVWARIVSRRGDAPYTLALGTLVMILLHPMGRVYAVLGVALIPFVFGVPRRGRVIWGMLVSLAMVAIAFALSAYVDRPVLGFRPEPYGHGQAYLTGVVESMTAAAVEIQRWGPALVHSKILFIAAVVFGFLALEDEARRRNLRILGVILVFRLVSFFYVLPSHPADLFMRLWPPSLILALGAIAFGLVFAAQKAAETMEARRRNRGAAGVFVPARDWPLLAAAVLVIYVFQLLLSNAEGLVATGRYMKTRQPLAPSATQANALLSRSEPSDRVLYDSITLMSFFFVNGALDRGAVYYPAIKGSDQERAWLSRPDLRFAVLYNPLVRSDRLRDIPEEKWWQGLPSVRYSPLHEELKRKIIAVEGRIPLHEFRFITIDAAKAPLGPLKLLVHNPGSRKRILITPASARLSHCEDRAAQLDIQPQRREWITVDLSRFPDAKGFKIALRSPDEPCFIGGVSFGDSRLNWPWKQRCEMRLVPLGGNQAPTVVCFDAARLLPEGLQAGDPAVLNDDGSSVLLRISDAARYGDAAGSFPSCAGHAGRRSRQFRSCRDPQVLCRGRAPLLPCRHDSLRCRAAPPLPRL